MSDGNPHSEVNGCEVNVCRARRCDPGRKEICYLRKCWQWRVNVLKMARDKAVSAGAKAIYTKRLKESGYDESQE